MFSAMLFAISIVALTQFALYYWRAVLSGVAAQPISDRVLAAANVQGGRLNAADFEKLAGLHLLTPDLTPSSGQLGIVRLYYQAVRRLGWLATGRLPALAAWTEREGAICARYAAVQIDRRLQANIALAASLRSC